MSSRGDRALARCRTVVCGDQSTIAQDFILCHTTGDVATTRLHNAPHDAGAYLICAGYLAGKVARDQSVHEIQRAFEANFVEVVQLCDDLIDGNPEARICIIGSESGFSGSHDMIYAGAKAALHLYIETKRLRTPEQLLVGIAPHIIGDSGMTRRRSDYEATIARGRKTRLGRWLFAQEVADLAAFLLYSASPALSNQVIRMRSE